MGAHIVEFGHSSITRQSQLPTDIPLERHIWWLRIRDPNTDKRKLSNESKQTLQWILKSLLPLLSSIPFHHYCHLTINAAADAFATDDTMGIGGWVTIQSSTFWFSQIWNKSDLLNVPSSNKSPSEIHYFMGSISSAMYHPYSSKMRGSPRNH